MQRHHVLAQIRGKHAYCKRLQLQKRKLESAPLVHYWCAPRHLSAAAAFLQTSLWDRQSAFWLRADR